MKKLIGSLALAALLAGAAFAEIGIGSWGRAIVAPIASNGDTNTTLLGTSWGMGGSNSFRATGLSFSGSSENFGFNVDVAGESVGSNDQALFWIKPVDFLEIKIGRIQEGTGRGSACFGSWNWIRPESFTNFGDDFTFARNRALSRGDGGETQGFTVKITPIEGLWILAAVDVGPSHGNDWWKAYVSENTKYAVGYNIANIGSIKAQFFPNGYVADGSWNGKFDGANPDKLNTQRPVLNAAFDLTAVENLFISLGAYIPLGNTYNWDTAKSIIKTQDPLMINLYASYNLNPVTIHLGIGTKIGTVTDLEFSTTGGEPTLKADGFGIVIAAGADVDLGAGFGLYVDFRYATSEYNNAGIKVNTASGSVKKNTNYDSLSFLIGLQKNVSNGYIGVGFQGTGNGGAGAGAHPKVVSNYFTWAVPVVLSGAF